MPGQCAVNLRKPPAENSREVRHVMSSGEALPVRLRWAHLFDFDFELFIEGTLRTFRIDDFSEMMLHELALPYPQSGKIDGNSEILHKFSKT